MPLARPGAVLVAADRAAARSGAAPRTAALEQALLARAGAWARSVAPRPAAASVIDPAAGALARAAALAFAEHGGPLLIAWPRLACWRPEHGAGALDDLSHGCDVSIGPVFDGGLYLLALARPLPQLLAHDPSSWSDPGAMGAALDAVQSAGLGLGLLRAERGLRSEADIAAALADPLLDDGLRGLLTDARTPL